MRFSPYASIPSETVGKTSQSNQEFFESVARRADRNSLNGSILLVGATDPRSLALRRAQAALRFDRLVSYWSHSALIVRWSSNVADVQGVEVSLDPSDYSEQVPERNGVTVFRLPRYFDAKRFPNVALLTLSFSRPVESPANVGSARSELDDPALRRTAVLEAALNPNRDRERYPFWDSLAVWARYSYAPHVTVNPLTEGVPLPSAALCEYAYEAAGVDLTPGATGNHNCPELLYATLKHWAEGLKKIEGVDARIFFVIRDESGTPQPTRPVRIDEIELSDVRSASPSHGTGSPRAKAPKSSQKRQK